MDKVCEACKVKVIPVSSMSEAEKSNYYPEDLKNGYVHDMNDAAKKFPGAQMLHAASVEGQYELEKNSTRDFKRLLSAEQFKDHPETDPRESYYFDQPYPTMPGRTTATLSHHPEGGKSTNIGHITWDTRTGETHEVNIHPDHAQHTQHFFKMLQDNMSREPGILRGPRSY